MLLFPPSHAVHRVHGVYNFALLGNSTVGCVCVHVCYVSVLYIWYMCMRVSVDGACIMYMHMCIICMYMW